MFEILQARIERDRPSWDRVAFWPVTDAAKNGIGYEPLIYAVKPSQILAAWMVTGIYPQAGGGFDRMHELPVIGESRERQMVFDVARALVQAEEIELLANEAETFRKRADDLRQLRSIADPNTAAALGSVFMGVARDRADMGLPTHMQLAFTSDGILTVNGKWSSRRPEDAITSWGLEAAQELNRLNRQQGRTRAKRNLKKS
jgi:hypothetical protein